MVSLTKTLGQISRELSKELGKKVIVEDTLSQALSSCASSMEIRWAFNDLKERFNKNYSFPYQMHEQCEVSRVVGYVYKPVEIRKKKN